MAVRRLAPKELQPATFEFTAENLAWAKKQIEKYPPARMNQIPHHAGTFRGKQLKSNFVNARSVANAGYKVLRLTSARNVQSDNEALPHRIPHPRGCRRG